LPDKPKVTTSFSLFGAPVVESVLMTLRMVVLPPESMSQPLHSASSLPFFVSRVAKPVVVTTTSGPHVLSNWRT